MTYRRTTTLTLRVVETIERDDDYSDDEHPSLSGVPVYDTTATEIVEPRPLAKCGPVPAARRKAGGR